MINNLNETDNPELETSIYDMCINDVENVLNDTYIEEQLNKIHTNLIENIRTWLTTKKLYILAEPNEQDEDKSGRLAPIIPISYPRGSEKIIEALKTLYTGKYTKTYIPHYGFIFETVLEKIHSNLMVYDEKLATNFLDKYKSMNLGIEKNKLHNLVIDAFNEKYYKINKDLISQSIDSFNMTVEEFCNLDVDLTDFYQNCEYRVEIEKIAEELRDKLFRIPNYKIVSMMSTYSYSMFYIDKNNKIEAITENEKPDELFVYHLMLALCDCGAITVREMLDENYDPHKDNDSTEILYENMYGCRIITGKYTWLTAFELKEVTIRGNKKLSLDEPTNVFYCYYPEKFE